MNYLRERLLCHQKFPVVWRLKFSPNKMGLKKSIAPADSPAFLHERNCHHQNGTTNLKYNKWLNESVDNDILFYTILLMKWFSKWYLFWDWRKWSYSADILHARAVLVRLLEQLVTTNLPPVRSLISLSYSSEKYHVCNE